MLFEEHAELPNGFRNEGLYRLSEGLVRGHRDTWVVIARDGVDLADWLGPDPAQADGSMLRICRAVLEDGTLVLEMNAGAAEHPFAALLDFD